MQLLRLLPNNSCAETSSNTAAIYNIEHQFQLKLLFTFTQGNIPPVRQDVPDDQWQSSLYLRYLFKGYKVVGIYRGHAYTPSGLTDPNGHAIVKWVADDGTEMEPERVV